MITTTNTMYVLHGGCEDEVNNGYRTVTGLKQDETATNTGTDEHTNTVIRKNFRTGVNWPRGSLYTQLK